MEDVIVRRLTADRIDELNKFIKEIQETHRYTNITFKHRNKSHSSCIIDFINDVG